MEEPGVVAVGMYLALYALLTGLFILWVSTVLYRCFRRSHPASGSTVVGPTIIYVEGADQGGMTRGGLDPTTINTFPKLPYSKSSAMTSGECAVCLGVFEEKETVRMLPRCAHVFHADCVDIWLRSHATCPSCRSVLLQQPPPLDRPSRGTTSTLPV